MTAKERDILYFIKFVWYIGIMLLFEKITEKSIPVLKKYLNKTTYYSCENTFGFIYLWSAAENHYICEQDEVLFVMSIRDGNANFYYPFGDKITDNDIEKIEEYCLNNMLKLCFWHVPQENVDTLENYFKGRLKLTADRNWADYLYSYEELLNLSGKKLHAQKNHFNQFIKTYNYEYVSYDDTKKALLADFFGEYYVVQNKESQIFKSEKTVLDFVLSDFASTELTGGLLIVDGKVIGFSFGEKVGDTLYVHFEKALKEYRGSYAAANKLFLEMCYSKELVYVNREEDVGDENLRETKLRLRPVRLVDKYFGEVE